MASATIKPPPSPQPSPSVVPPEPPVLLTWGVTEEDLADARATAAAMTVEEVAGQVVVASFRGQDPAAAASLLAEQHLAGVILMAGNIGERGQVLALTSQVQAAQAATGRDWPAVIGVDQEGGAVARLGTLVPEMPPFMAAGAVDDAALVRSVYQSQGADVRDLGFTMTFSPVADIATGLDDPVIRARSAGDRPALVAQTATAATLGFLDAGIIPTLKHFPGHGSVTVDSHVDLPVQTAPVSVLAGWDLVPFAAGVDAGAPVIMMSHVAVPEWGSEPSTLSPAAYAYLRDALGFDGVIVTDALNMGAVTDRYGAGQAAVVALGAGADLLLMPADTEAALAGIVSAVASGELPRERLDEAAARVIALMRAQAEAAHPPARLADVYVEMLAAAAVTVSAADCAALLPAGPVVVTGGPDGARAALEASLVERGVTIGPGGATIVLLAGPAAVATADVVVALDAPWGLSLSTAPTLVGAFGDSPAAMNAVAAVLTGDAEPRGHWPVRMGTAARACPAG